MEAATVVRRARLTAGMTLRQLGAAAQTSHSALAAYEAGDKTPTVATLDRIVRAAGFALDPLLARRAVGGTIAAWDGPTDRGAELEAVLGLAAAFPARHDPVMRTPVFPRR